MGWSLDLFAWFLCLVCSCWADNVPTTQLYIRKIEPQSFNWTDNDVTELLEDSSQFWYRPSLLNASDLPSWMHYTASDQFNYGFLYGSPPNKQDDYQIEVIGLNRKTYETRSCIIQISVVKISDPGSTVQLKVDRVSVEEMLLAERHGPLLDVFRRDLWPESAADLHLTFLASAVELGARLPLDPTHGEGVVIKISSRARFSQTLEDLQQEIRPLRTKGNNCPDFKHTSVERFFKQYNFSLDWCAFHLLDYNLTKEPELVVADQVSAGPQLWKLVNKSDLPTKQYDSELDLIMYTPVLGFTLLVALLSFILCVQDGKEDESSPAQLVQYEAVHRAGNTLRSLSAQRDTSTSEPSPRVSMERAGLRPNPPPYSGVHHVTRDEFLDDEEPKTWYC